MAKVPEKGFSEELMVKAKSKSKNKARASRSRVFQESDEEDAEPVV